MKRKIASLILFLIMAGLSFAVPASITLQGRLVDANGMPLGDKTITNVRLYAGNNTAAELTLGITTSSDGFFYKVVTLSSDQLNKFKLSQITGFKVNVAGIIYPSDGFFVVTSVPYALSADYVGGMTTQELSTSIINSTQTIVNNSTVWQQGTSKIYYNNGAVGIGTSEPSAKLEVVGSNAIKGTYSGDKSVFGVLGDPTNFAVQGLGSNVSIGANEFSFNDNYFNAAQKQKSLVGVYGQAGTSNVGMLGAKFYTLSGVHLGDAGVYGKSSSGNGGQFESDSGYGVYSSAPKNYFSGKIGVGKQDPSRALDIDGGLRVSSPVLGAEISGGIGIGLNSSALLFGGMFYSAGAAIYASTESTGYSGIFKGGKGVKIETGSLAVGTSEGKADLHLRAGSGNADLLLESYNGKKWNLASSTGGNFFLAIKNDNGTYNDRLILEEKKNSLLLTGLTDISPAGDYVGLYAATDFNKWNNYYSKVELAKARIDSYGHFGSAYGVKTSVYGYNGTSYGLYGEAQTYGEYSYGVFGVGSTGVYGQGTAGGSGSGVEGTGTYIGVKGVTTGSSSMARGVWGVSNHTGVMGEGKQYDFYANGDGLNYGASSSIRWKENIKLIDNPIKKVKSLRGVYFDWKKDHGGKHDVGMIAEEVGKVLPEIVVYNEKDKKYADAMDYSKLTPLLIEAVKDQQKQIDELKKEIESLKKK